jgi:hypothetical protein
LRRPSLVRGCARREERRADRPSTPECKGGSLDSRPVLDSNHCYARRVDVSVQREADGRFLVELAADEREVKVRLSATEIGALIKSAHWSERGIIQAGESAGAPVFWTSDGKQARLLIGHDDETRDVAITVPFRVVDEIVRGAIVSEVPVTVPPQSYEPPPPDADLVRRLRAAIASVPDLHEAYLVARRTAWPEREELTLGVVAHAGGGSRPRRSLEALRVALAPFSPPSEAAPLGWVAYSNSPVPDEVRGAGIRLA